MPIYQANHSHTRYIIKELPTTLVPVVLSHDVVMYLMCARLQCDFNIVGSSGFI